MSLLRLFLPLALGLAAAGPTAAEPFRPARDDQPLERLPRTSSVERAQLRALQARRGQAGGDLEGALKLADSYIEIGRRDADPRFYGYAEGALAAWISEEDPPSPILLRRAAIRQFRHDFAGALDDLDQLIAGGVSEPQVWLLKASILRVQGRYVAAMDSCAQLRGRADPLVGLTCACEVQSLAGKGRVAYESLSRALATSGPPGAERPAGVLAWSWLVLAGVAERQGEAPAAERAYRAALAAEPEGAMALAAYADFLLDQHRPAEAVRLLKGRQAHDGLLLRASLAQAQVEPAAAARLAAPLKARFDAIRARGERPHLGDEARFELALGRRPQAAWRYALENWRQLREPRDALTLAQGALATGDRSAARTALRQLDGRQNSDRRLAALHERLALAAR